MVMEALTTNVEKLLISMATLNNVTLVWFMHEVQELRCGCYSVP